MLKIILFFLFIYLIIEDIRKTYINDIIIYITFFLSALYSLFTNPINLLFGFFILYLFTIFYSYGFMGDADGFVLASVIFAIGIKNFILLLPLASYCLSLITLILISLKKNKIYIVTLILSLILLIFINLFVAEMYLLILLLIILSKKENLYELVKRKEILDLDVILINNKEYIVVDKKNIPKIIKFLNPFYKLKNKNKIDINELNLFYYYRRIPIPFLPFIIPYALSLIFPQIVNISLCSLLYPLIEIKKCYISLV